MLAGGSVLALLLAAATLLWIFRIEFITWGVARALENQGLGPASFQIQSIRLSSFHAKNVSLRNGTIQASDLTAEFGLEDLLAGHMERLEIAGFSTEFIVNDQGVTWDGRPFGSAAPTASTSKSPIAGLRIDELSFRDAKVKISTKTGSFDATISATLSIADGIVESKDIAAQLHIALSGSEHRLSMTAQQVTLALPASGEANLTLLQASVSPDALAWKAEGIDAEINYAAGIADMRLLSARLSNLQTPALIPPVALAGAGRMEAEKISFTAEGTLQSRENVVFQAKGEFDQASASGYAELLPVTITFRPGQLQPQDLSPLIDKSIGHVTGAITLAGKFSWKDNTLAPLLSLRLSKLGLSLPSMNMRDLTGAITINRFAPLTTLPDQALSATLEIPGIPTAQLTLKGQLLNGPALRVQALSVDIAGGEIKAAPLTIRTGNADIATTLSISNLDMAEVTKLLSIEGLDGTGRLDGTIPLHVKGSQVAIEKGNLKAREAGTLRYRPESLPEAISKSHSSVELAFQALTDFHYDKLDLSLDKDVNGDGTVMLHLQGQNPAVMSGQPFNFNIRVDSNFDRLAEYALVSIRSAQELLNRAARRSGY